jgi:hypothetical protein
VAEVRAVDVLSPGRSNPARPSANNTALSMRMCRTAGISASCSGLWSFRPVVWVLFEEFLGNRTVYQLHTVDGLGHAEVDA